jgi:hypothetical protein
VNQIHFILLEGTSQTPCCLEEVSQILRKISKVPLEWSHWDNPALFAKVGKFLHNGTIGRKVNSRRKPAPVKRTQQPYKAAVGTANVPGMREVGYSFHAGLTSFDCRNTIEVNANKSQ